MKDKRQVRDPVSRYIAQRLRQIRMERGMPVKEAAERSGVAASSYSCLENGFYKIHSDNLFRILNALGAGIEEVWPQASQSPQGRVNSRYMEEAVRQSMERQPRPLGLDDILQAVSRAFQVPKQHLVAPSLNGPLQAARAACGLLISEMPGVTQRELAEAMGISGPSLSHHQKRMRKRAEEDPAFQETLQQARQQLSQAREGTE